MAGSHGEKTGKLIIFEGPDGVGKSTISTAVATHIESCGEPVLLLTFPGKEQGTLGQLVYDVHHDPMRFGVTDLTPASKQALHIAAHLDAIERVIIPALYSGRHVVLDRFWWSTWVYGVVGGINRRVLQRMIDVELAQWGKVRPALAILLRRETPIDRDANRLDWLALRSEYDLLAERELTRHPVVAIDNVTYFDATVARVTSEVLSRLWTQRVTGQTPSDRVRQFQIAFAGTPPQRARPSTGPNVLSPIAPARPTEVYDSYWRFAAERQSIFFKRLEGHPPPWTDDAVLNQYKFTNAYRASDRVSQYLIRHVIYGDDCPVGNADVFFRIILFKLFNKIETWELLEGTFGIVTYADYRFDRYDTILTEAMSGGQSIYSAAYIMPPGGHAFGETLKHRNHLRLLDRMMADDLPARLADARSMQAGFDLLRAYPTIGDFLAYQFITDINYSEITHFTEMEFVIPGPGALDGIRKCFLDCGGLNEPEIIRFMADRQDDEFRRLGLEFRSLWGRPLQLIDCQNLFCEVDKYARVMHPHIAGRSGRTRIKQRFAPTKSPIPYTYPPKWALNDAVEMVSSRPGAPTPVRDM